MDVDGARQKRQHTQREAHEKTEKIEIRPAHKSPSQSNSTLPPISISLCNSTASSLMTVSGWLQHFCETIEQARCPQNLCKKQQRRTRIRRFRDGDQRALQLRINSELACAGVKPGIHFRIDGPKLRLQARCVAFGVVDQKAGIHAEEAREQVARLVSQVGPGATLDLRKVSLAQTAADFALHR